MSAIDPMMSAAEAAEALGVSASTLYAYVSRGMVRSVADGRSRARRYHRADVEALITRKAQRREPEKVAEAALSWGAPVLDSALSLIQDGRLYYRGLDAVEVANTWPLERLAAFMWTGDAASPLFEGPAPAMSPRLAEVARAIEGLPLIERLQVLLPIAGAEDFAAYDVRPEAVPHTGARLLRLMAAIAANGPVEGDLAGAIAESWSPGRPEAAVALRAALVLSADHELNVSAFTARCVASAGSTPYAAVVAGLSALQGPRHGGHSDRVEALFAEVGEPGQAAAVLASRLRRGDEIPGFGHPLYPTGDPRGRALLDWAARLAPDAPGLALGRALASAGQDILGAAPTIDFGLVTLSRAMGWPRGTPIALFALGRSIGWIAHVIEQYATDRLIRPRARYTGPAPSHPLSSEEERDA